MPPLHRPVQLNDPPDLYPGGSFAVCGNLCCMKTRRDDEAGGLTAPGFPYLEDPEEPDDRDQIKVNTVRAAKVGSVRGANRRTRGTMRR